MDLPALEKVAAFCRSGGTVIATRRLPDRSYGLLDRRRTDRLRALVTEMFGAAATTAGRTTERRYGQGRAIFAPDELDSLAHALESVPRDVTFSPYQPEVSFVHRRDGARDIYFLANVGPTGRAFTARFPRANGHLTLWDPMDGRTREAAFVEPPDGLIAAPIELAPRGSIFAVIEPRPPGTPARPAEPARVENVSETELNLEWNVTFPGIDRSTPRAIRELVSWTVWPESRFYSGTATYTGQIVWDRPAPRRARLVFSQVHEVAAVELNGVSAGVAWTPLYEVDVTGQLHPGTNALSITVANLPLNRFLGLPDEDLRPLRAVYGNRFPDPEEKQVAKEPAPSGLIGPVRLRVVPR